MDETFLTVVKNKYIEILLVGLILWLAVFMINKALQIFFKRTEFIEDKKKKTIESLVKSVSKYTASICFVLYVISLFFHDFGKILAGAGVAGIVIGFGAQTLIRDILAGIFLIYERQIHKGDYVTVNNLFNGTIEEIGLRSLQIREWRRQAVNHFKRRHSSNPKLQYALHAYHRVSLDQRKPKS